MKKVFDQTVRDLKREVNKKVLKVPSIEQKILDATSNEPWGPHGSHLADIAQATRNYHEYQMIMTVIWKRINDTGKNWRHVYKALTVLEYLVAHGSERVIDEIREHAYQLSSLSDFQYIDSAGRDQGNNVRKKSQSLVSLVNDKERIDEARQKALANRDKFRSAYSAGGAYGRGGGYGDRYDDDQYDGRYGNRDDEPNAYEKEKDWGNRDHDRYGRHGDLYNHDGHRHGRDPDECYDRDSYRDDDYRGHGNDDYQYGSRNRSTDREPDRSNGGRADDISQDERRLEHKLSEPVGAPPSYEEATKDTHNHVHGSSGGASVAPPAEKSSPPAAPKESSPSGNTSQDSVHAGSSLSVAVPTNAFADFDKFDPRGSASAAHPAASSPEMDFFGSLSASDSSNQLALMPVASAPNAVASSAVSTISGEADENLFGDPPFKATPENFSVQLQSSVPPTSFQQQPGMTGVAEPFPPAASKVETVPSFDFGDSLGGAGITFSLPNNQHYSLNTTSQPQQLPGIQATNDILDGLLPPTSNFITSVPAQAAAAPTHMQTDQMSTLPQADPLAASVQQAVPFASQVSQSTALNMHLSPSGPFFQPSAIAAPYASASPTSIQMAPPGPHPQHSVMVSPYASSSAMNIQIGPPSTLPQSAIAASYVSAPPTNTQTTNPGPLAPSAVAASYASTSSENIPMAPHASTSSANIPTVPPGLLQAASTPAGPTTKPQPSKDKFETKSTVWADTLSRGLVNLNISGPKINPLADIGIDFDSIKRMEKRKEAKSSAATITSTISMGKAMGTGSGIGRAGASGLAPPPNSMTGGGMGMGIGMGMGGYGGGMNQQPMGMGMGMNMGMGFGAPMRQAIGMPPSGPGMPGADYNPTMGMGNYGPQQPFGGGYR